MVDYANKPPTPAPQHGDVCVDKDEGRKRIFCAISPLDTREDMLILAATLEWELQIMSWDGQPCATVHDEDRRASEQWRFNISNDCMSLQCSACSAEEDECLVQDLERYALEDQMLAMTPPDNAEEIPE